MSAPRLSAALLALWLAALSSAAQAEPVTVYKTPTCGCCVKWIEHLEAAGFEVEAVDVPDTSPIRRAEGVPPHLGACHTARVGGYAIEGHVPAEDVARLLREKPEVVGLAVPGMPLGSPGMEVPNPARHERYSVLAFDEQGRTTVFATHGP